jgi:oligopeptide/dipeptide ABC transporter ATP-binding protein
VSLLEIHDLRVHFHTDDGVVKAVDGVDFEVDSGTTLGIVGESGCGKSVANMTILGLTRAPNVDISGRILFEGRDLVTLKDEALHKVRGREIAMIFQDPLTSLHPFYRIGKQITEAITTHREVSKEEANDRAAELLAQVGIPSPVERLRAYPHELSGGMRQRVMIAMALANDPKVLIADEPTTALDVTIQAQILQLLERLSRELGLAVIMITHDLGVISEVADQVNVMYAGRVVESGDLEQIFYDPQHPYTWGLLGSIARPDQPRAHRLSQINGQPPSLLAPPEGCHFRPRCPHEFDHCPHDPPLESRLREDPGHRDRCWLSPGEKRMKRQVSRDRIGLEAK